MEEVNNGNKLIADFMGFAVKEFHGMLCLCGEDESPWDYEPIQWFTPNQSWGDLMPVVEKINKTITIYGAADVVIFRNTCHINDPQQIIIETTTPKGGSLIDCVWLAIVEFIQWHNEK